MFRNNFVYMVQVNTVLVNILQEIMTKSARENAAGDRFVLIS